MISKQALLPFILSLFMLVFSAVSQANEIVLTQEEKTWLLNHQEVRVHNEVSWGPFNYHEFGRPKGYSIEFMNLLAAKLDIEIKYVTGPTWGEFLNMLDHKELDVMLNIIKTEDRSKYILFTDPYVNNPSGIVVRDDNRTVRDLRDLNGRVLAIPKGFFYQEIIEKHFPGIQLLLLKDQVDSLKAVAFGRADATMGGIAVQNHLIRKHLMSNLKVVGGIDDPRFANLLRLGVREDWPIFRSILQKAIESVTKEERDRLNRRWLEGGLQRTQALHLDKEEQEFLSSHPVLRVHNEMAWPPFNYNEQGKPKGFSIDVMNLIAKKTGFRIQYISGPNWSDFLEMSKERKLDMMLNIVNTAERRNYIRFTRPYAVNPNVIVSKKGTKYESIESLFDKTVAIPKGFFYEEILTNEYPQVKLHLVTDALESLKAISIGKADAALGEAAVFNHLIAKNLMNDLTVSGEVDVGKPDLANLRIGVRSDWPILQRIMDRAIESLTRDEVASISQRWMGNENYIARPGSGLSLTATEKNYLEKQPGITFCANPDWMPLEQIGPGGRHDGMVADYLNLMADRIGIGMTMLPTENSQQSLEYAQNRRCDIMSAAFETPEATRQLNFTKPYLRLPLVIAIQEDSLFVDGLKSLKDKTVGVPKGYGLLNKFKQDYPSLNIIEVDNVADGLRIVEEGRIFGLIGAIAPVGHAIRKHRFLNLKIGGRLDEDWKLAVAIRNDSPELLSMFNKATDYITEEEHSKVFQRWVSVKFEHDTNYDLIWKLIFAAIIIITAITLWNWKLSRLNKKLKLEIGLRETAETQLQILNETLNSKNDELSILSTTDALTGLNNRLHIETLLEEELFRLQQFKQPLTILLLDVDLFKKINDQHGHLCGDSVLKQFAQIIVDNTRKTDKIGRWGGEEFMILLPETNAKMAYRLAEKLRTAIAAELFEEVDQVTASFGLAEATEDQSSRELIKKADSALYQAKDQGRNCVVGEEKALPS
ncbi:MULTISPECIES: transporter substrate-binding domain-containing protein [unclassified Neptuniibacter]|uniref:transporter substrate-binding domain-containing diguanylate cyclase n=1 Tax=unclassified Neptuniibacter TaxID=2630693 RepID=UPI0025F6A265|nr:MULTISPECIES: transporter substrate-binding domain-containing protein [unclassified Neptuniibacter]